MRTMMRGAVTLAAGVAILTFGHSAQAQSGLDACGNIWIEANAECEVEPPGVDCETMCTPLRFEAACAQDLSIQCQGQCDVDVSTELPECQTSCETECTQDPTRYDCHTSCEARCGAGCSASCSGGAGGGHCEASCQASCALNCDTECTELPPTYTCVDICEHSCRGSLKAELSVDCQMGCQTNLWEDCELRMEGGCTTDCTVEDGALFCDGQFVDHDNNLEECIDALRNLDITVDWEASGSVSVGCSAAAGEVPSGAALLVLLPALMLFWRRRR